MNLYHVPNEAKRSAATGALLKEMGMSAGVPDLILDYPAGVYHGLRLELKYGKNTPTNAQKDWLLRMQKAGYFVAVAWSARVAIHLLEEYVALAPGQRMSEDCPNAKMRWGFPEIRADREVWR